MKQLCRGIGWQGCNDLSFPMHFPPPPPLFPVHITLTILSKTHLHNYTYPSGYLTWVYQRLSLWLTHIHTQTHRHTRVHTHSSWTASTLRMSSHCFLAQACLVTVPRSIPLLPLHNVSPWPSCISTPGTWNWNEKKEWKSAEKKGEIWAKYMHIFTWIYTFSHSCRH